MMPDGFIFWLVHNSETIGVALPRQIVLLVREPVKFFVCGGRDG